MIKATRSADGLAANVICSGVAIYLDTFAIIRLAKGDPSRRQRFVAAVHSKADLIFSVANAAELIGPQEDSLEAVKNFLNEIGAHWFPVELDTFEVVARERNGAQPSKSCLSPRFVQDFASAQFADQPLPTAGEVISLGDDFFRLGRVLDWLVPQRASILEGSRKFDEVLAQTVDRYRGEFDRDPQWLDRYTPALSFNPSIPATFVHANLLRTLVKAKGSQSQLKKGDGLDFSHAVMGSAFANIAALDKAWKARVESLPQPNGLARIYYEPELDAMVSDIENHVRALEAAEKSQLAKGARP